MYLLELHFANTAKNKRGKFIIPCRKSSIRKWTILSSEDRNLEILRLIALATANPEITSRFNFPVTQLVHNPQMPIHFEFLIFHHSKTEGPSKYAKMPVGSGITISKDGVVKSLSRLQCQFLGPAHTYRRPRASNKPAKHFLLAYGPHFQSHVNTDDFGFNNPFYALARFHTLFFENVKITDPVAFLEIIRHRGIRYKRLSALQISREIRRLFETCLEADPFPFWNSLAGLKGQWQKLYPWQQRMAMPILDICRHFYDAFPKANNPFEMPGVILLNRPDRFCTPKRFVSWINYLDSLLPNVQFITTLSRKNTDVFPGRVAKKRLAFLDDKTDVTDKKAKPPCLPRRPILLIHVDGKFPNLALMKLSRYYKEQGKNVVLQRKPVFLKNAEKIYASSIFNFPASKSRIQALKKYYGDAIIIGGSGVSLSLRLSEKIENLPADYSLYPELQDRAIGFVTRGCPHRCPFCIVPEKEGPPHFVSSIRSLVGKNKTKLILLDDNILSHPESGTYLEEMASRNLKVNFTQTLDMRYVNKEKAKLLGRIQCMNTKFSRPNYYFSLNNNKRFGLIRKKYRMLDFSYKDNVEFICMYGFNTTLEQDLERFKFLRSLPGAYVFTQQYKPVKDVKTLPEDQYFSGDVDRMLDELVRIVFPQNMKSMEKFYKWISKKYAKAFNRLHMGLVDTIFKYNNRSQKGRYIATLAGTRKQS